MRCVMRSARSLLSTLTILGALLTACGDDGGSSAECRTVYSLPYTCPDAAASTQPCVMGSYQSCSCKQADVTMDTPATPIDVPDTDSYAHMSEDVATHTDPD